MRRPRSPRRFRHRLLAAMLVVALVPLAAFATLVVADLGDMSRSTVDQTHQTILADARDRELGAVGDRAKFIDVRLSSLAADVGQLRDQLADKVPPAAAAGAAVAVTSYRGVGYVTSPDSSYSVVVGPTDREPAASAAARAGAISATGQQVRATMQGLLKAYPEVETVWLADQAGNSLMSVPGFDVQGTVTVGRVSSATQWGPSGDLFTTSEKEFASSQNSGDWLGPRATSRQTGGPYWTDPYATRQFGDEGVTVWLPVGDGHTVVGADIAVARIASQAVTGKISGDPNAYALLLTSSNRVLAAGGDAAADFGPGVASPGGTLVVPKDKTFATSLAQVERRGDATVLSVKLGGVDKELFTAPIYSAHWVLATSLPVADLEPDVIALTKGVDSGIHRLLVEAIPVALLLCVLAFVLARTFALRLVTPVKELTTAAERLALGQTEEPVPPQGSDEVGVLAASLERMRREINTSRGTIMAAAHELEVRVADRTAELRVRNEELVALNELAGSLTRSLDPDVILTEALAAVRAIVPMTAGRGFVAVRGSLRPLAGDITGSANGRVSSSDDGLTTIAAAAVDEGTIVHHETPDGLLVGVPLATSEGVAGALAFLLDPNNHASQATPLLRAIADQVGLALRTASLSAEGRATAVLEERTRLAREIHDTLAQQLTAIVLQLEAAEALVPEHEGSATSRQAVVLARDLARSALHEARRSVWDLRPTPLAATGLAAALEAEVQQWSERTGIATRIRTEAMPIRLGLAPRAEVAVLRITQEALSNIAKHSGATHVSLRLGVDGGELTLLIRDNGCGFDATAPERRADAFGLVGIEERARLAGGTAEVRSEAAKGTTIIVRVPLRESRAGRNADVASKPAYVVAP